MSQICLAYPLSFEFVFKETLVLYFHLLNKSVYFDNAFFVTKCLVNNFPCPCNGGVGAEKHDLFKPFSSYS